MVIQEISALNRGISHKDIDEHKYQQEFQSIFAIPTYKFTEIYLPAKLIPSRVLITCVSVLSMHLQKEASYT